MQYCDLLICPIKNTYLVPLVLVLSVQRPASAARYAVAAVGPVGVMATVPPSHQNLIGPQSHAWPYLGRQLPC